MLFARWARRQQIFAGCSFGFGGRNEDEEEGSGDRLAFIASFLEQGFGTSLRVGLGFSMTCGV